MYLEKIKGTIVKFSKAEGQLYSHRIETDGSKHFILGKKILSEEDDADVVRVGQDGEEIGDGVIEMLSKIVDDHTAPVAVNEGGGLLLQHLCCGQLIHPLVDYGPRRLHLLALLLIS